MKFVKVLVSAALISGAAGSAIAQTQLAAPTVSSKLGATPTTQVAEPAPAAQPAMSGTLIVVGLALAILAAAASD
jgi:hypothetical protein